MHPIVRAILIGTVRISIGLVSLAVVAAVTYLTMVQPWHLGWGASSAELERELPGDEIVPRPDYQCTRAITIRAPADEVWRWLVQIGQDRGGFYSYDWLERLMGLEIDNADRIVAEWQTLEAGDSVGLGPGVAMEVAAIRRGRWLVFDMRRWMPASWAFVLDPIQPQKARLIIRMRCQGEGLHYSPFDPGHFIMERRMMHRIKELAETSVGAGRARPGIEGLWFAAWLAAGPGILLLLVSRRWPWSLAIAAAAAACWVLLLFRGHPSSVFGGLLVAALAGANYWSWRRRR